MQYFSMDSIDYICDNYISNEYLDDQLKNTRCLRDLYQVLNLKNVRLLKKKCEKVVFPVHKIYEQNVEDVQLQREVLKLALLVTENEDQEVMNVITYLNLQLSNFYNHSAQILLKVVNILHEILVWCKYHNKDVFKESEYVYIHKFLLYNIECKKSPFRTYVMSNIIYSYIILLGDVRGLQFLNEIFCSSKSNDSLDVLCVIFGYTDIQLLLIQEQTSFLYKEEFWIFLANSLSRLDNNSVQKQAEFLLAKLVESYNSYSINIPYIRVGSKSIEESKKAWQHYFVLLQMSKEKQLHLIWPSLTLLNSVKHLNNLWQKSVYKIFLNHTQNSISCFIIDYILRENIYFPELFKYLLLAINKNDSLHKFDTLFEKLPLYCNNLKQEDFLIFVEDILTVTWTPVAMWYFFQGLFCFTLDKQIPLPFFGLIYQQILKIPHIYIRNCCTNKFIIYFLSRYEYKDSADCICKMLIILKDYDEDLFVSVALNHIDVTFVNTLYDTDLINDKSRIKQFEILVQLLKILKIEDKIYLIAKNIEKLDNEFCVIVYANLFEYFNISTMEEVVEKIECMSKDSIHNILSIVMNLMNQQHFRKNMYNKIINILSKPNDHNGNTIYLALYIAKNYFKSCDIIKKIVTDGRKPIFSICNQFDDDTLLLFIELYFLIDEKHDTDMLFVENICTNQSDFIISKLFYIFSTTVTFKDTATYLYFLKLGKKVLPNLTKSRYFNTSFLNYINCVFSISSSTLICDEETLNVLQVVIDMLVQFTDVYSTVAYSLSNGIRYFVIQCDCDDNYSSNILIPVIVEMLLKGIIVKKEERIEYTACQDIYKETGKTKDNPNVTKACIKLSSLDSMLQMINKTKGCADDFASCLMEKYKIHFKKRYFPDSQIHIQKLRIIQALLIIYPFIKDQRQPLIDLLMESFCVEIHQPCVKQLMQWLLYSLLKHDNDALSLIAAKIESATKTQPSTVAAFMLVLLYLTRIKSESFWFSVVEVLLPWCMGPHFKLRIYAQMTIKALEMEARNRDYQNFLLKYGFLEKSINFIVEASGQACHDTLKTDALMFYDFNPERDYSVQTIFIDIPKLNSVTESEWENIEHYKFASLESVPILNEDKSFAVVVNDTKKSEEKKDPIPFQTVSEDNFNIQRKIIPWKTVFEEEQNNKKLGDFILIASLIDKPTNLGGLSRTCEVFGVKQLVLNNTKIITDKDFRGLSMTSENWVEFVEVKIGELKQFIYEIREKGYCIIGAEQTSESISLNEYKFKKRTALLLGNEKEGIPPEIIPILDACIEIPQFGLVRSLNVHVAGATFIWEYAKQHLVK